MNECDRISCAECGCRYDKPSGLMVHFCEVHDPDGSKNRINKFVGNIHRNAQIDSPLTKFTKRGGKQ
jgi:hypothetical protein